MWSLLRPKENSRGNVRGYIRTPLAAITAVIFAVAAVFSGAAPLFAQQGSLSMTVTPPLFQVSLQPGEVWRSSIRVVNSNAYDMKVYASAVSFEPTGEEGRPKFVPIIGPAGTLSATLAGWIELSSEPTTIMREQTASIPFTVAVPENAPPGGHYAAILVTNSPPDAGEGNQVSVASAIASLLLMRVAGDVVEDGRIRDFYTEQSLYQSPEGQFTLRFENQGNVHLLPQGGITIYNMWGKERGYIPVNQEDTNFGNVLPGSIRKFSFTWKGDEGLYDIGRYRAVATLAYGTETRQNVTTTTYFWIIPIWTAIKVLGVLTLFIAFFFWAIRAYVRKALALEAAHLEAHGQKAAPQTDILSDIPALKEVTLNARKPTRPASQSASTPLSTFMRPIAAGVVDLRSLTQSKAPNVPETPRSQTALTRKKPQKKSAQLDVLTFSQFFRKYAPFLAFLVIVAAGIVAASAYFEDVLTYERDYEIRIDRPDNEDIILRTDIPEEHEE